MSNRLWQWAGKAVASAKEVFDELLHPRGPDGRFIEKWGMDEPTARSIGNLLTTENERTFPSDAAAGQFAFNTHHKTSKPGWNIQRFIRDFDGTNEQLRAGKSDASTAAYVKMMDDSSAPLDQAVIATRMVSPEAFGLGPDAFTPKPIPEEPDRMVTDVENLTGKLIADRGYTTAGIGTEYNSPAGVNKIRMITLAPKGTKALFTGASSTDRRMVFDKDQEFRVTQVLPDGQGGFHVYTVATPRTPGETPAPVNVQAGQPTQVVPGQAMVKGLTPDQMIGNIEGLKGRDLQDRARAVGADPSGTDEEVRRKIRERAQAAIDERRAQIQPQVAPVQDNNVPGPSPTGPNAPPPRAEQVRSEAVGGGTAAPQAPAAPGEAPAAPGEAPAAPGRPSPAHFRQLVRDQDTPIPSEGRRRNQWNKAYTGVASGKKDPEDALRELDTDIAVNRRLQQSNEDRNISDPELATDVEAQEALADLIAQTYELPRRPREAPAAREPVPRAERPRPARAVAPAEPEAPPRPAPVEETRESFKEIQARRRAARQAQPVSELPEAPPGVASEAPVSLRDRALESLQEQGIENPRPEMLREQMRALRDIEQSQVVRERSGGGAPAKKAAPAKKVAPTKKAAAEAGDIEAMTKADLLKEAGRRDIKVAPSWTKDRIKQALRGEGPEPKKRAPAKKAAPPPAPLKATGALPKRAPGGVPTSPEALERRRQFVQLAGDRGATPSAASEARNKAETDFANGRDAKEIAADLRKEATRLNKAGGNDDSVTYLRGLARKVTAPPKKVAAPRKAAPRKAAAPVAPKPARVTKADLMRQADEKGLTYRKSATKAQLEELIANAPEGGKRDAGKDLPATALRRDEPLNEERAQEFRMAWDAAGLSREDMDESTQEIADNIAAGEYSPRDGLTRLENDIDFNKQDLAEVERQLRRTDLPEGEKALNRRQAARLRKVVKDQEAASKLLRSHFEQEPVLTKTETTDLSQKIQEELPELPGFLAKASPDDMREAAKANGLPEPKGSTVAEMWEDNLRNVVKRELEHRAAKKAAPRKVQAPEQAPGQAWQTINVREVASGLKIPDRILDDIQKDLDNPKLTPAKIAKQIEDGYIGGSTGVRTRRAILLGVNERRDKDSRLLDPEREAQVEAEAKDLAEQGDELQKLVDRLKVTRRKRATAPRPEPVKLTPEENKQVKQAAETADVSVEKVRANVTAKKEAAAPASDWAKNVADQLGTISSKEEGAALLKGKTKPELQQIAKAMGVSFGAKDPKQKIHDEILFHGVQRRLTSQAIGGQEAGPAWIQEPPDGPRVKRASRQGMSAARLAADTGRTNGDEPLVAPNNGDDQGLVHFDSEIGQLWQDLVSDDREPNSVINKITDIGHKVGTGQMSLDEAALQLNSLKQGAKDKGVADRIQRAIDGITAPPAEPFTIPDTVPPKVREWLEAIAKIPTMRMRNPGMSRRERSVLDEARDLVMQIDSGTADRDADMKLDGLTNNIHESIDGVYHARRLTAKMNLRINRDIETRKWLLGRSTPKAPTTPEAPPEGELSSRDQEVMKMTIPELRNEMRRRGLGEFADLSKGSMLDYLIGDPLNDQDDEKVKVGDAVTGAGAGVGTVQSVDPETGIVTVETQTRENAAGEEGEPFLIKVPARLLSHAG